LKPGPKQSLPAARAWAERVRAEHEQAERVRHGAAESDYWRQFSHRFVPSKDGDGGRDGTVDALLAIVRPEDSVLDVGAGGGRIALPLAEKCRLVTAVEPSEGMRERLKEQVAKWGVRNLKVVAAKWEDARVGPADVVVCAHVVYTVPDPARFVDKLDSHALRLVAAVIFEQPAVAAFFPLWPPVHGEERLALPALAEFEALLKEMRVRYHRTRLPVREPRGFESVEQAVAESAARLFVSPGTLQAERLEQAVKESLVPHEAGFRFKWARPQQPWLVTWAPKGAPPPGRRGRASRTGSTV
jgi:SAM-dependent methyltransferase